MWKNTIRQRGIVTMIEPTRSEYFKTALRTAVGDQKRVIDVQECSAQVIMTTFATFANTTFCQKCFRICVWRNITSAQVLATAVDFIYGISIPEELSSDDAKSLLTMADLYLMEDLKMALAPLLGKQLSKDNILEISMMAEKYTAHKLMDICSDFILTNKTDLLGELFLALPSVAESCFEKQQILINFANKVCIYILVVEAEPDQ